MAIKLAVVQYGDYKAAIEARQQGKNETYRAQYYSMDAVDQFLETSGKALVICLNTKSYHIEVDNYELIGGQFEPSSSGIAYHRDVQKSANTICDHLKTFAPTHLLIRAPGWVMTLVGGWGIKNKISVLPIFADYFDTTTWKQRLRKKRMVHLLNSQSIPVVCNHNLPACQSMRTAGVDQNKILTYDWPAIRYPENHPVKSLPDKNENATIVYAGSVSESKGVGDLLEAIRLLKDDNCKCQLFICGKGADYDTYRHHVQQSSIRDSVTFEGLLSNTDVLKKMEEATLVVVPSHSEFPEGLPNVIYESFETRTPLVCSDHPSFKQLLTPEEGCLFFPQKSPKTLADRIRRALTSESDYTALSRTTSQAWQRVQCPLTFGQVLTAWKQSTDDALTKLLKKGGLKSVEHATKTASNN